MENTSYQQAVIPKAVHEIKSQPAYKTRANQHRWQCCFKSEYMDPTVVSECDCCNSQYGDEQCHRILGPLGPASQEFVFRPLRVCSILRPDVRDPGLLRHGNVLEQLVADINCSPCFPAHIRDDFTKELGIRF